MYFVFGYDASASTDRQFLSISPVSHTDSYFVMNDSTQWQSRRLDSPYLKQNVASQASLSQRFQALSTLKDGWFDGEGVAPDPSPLALIETRMLEGYPTHLPMPAIVPTPEGNLLLEWHIPGEPSVDINLSNLEAAYHSFQEEAPDIEMEFDLSIADEWLRFFTFLDSTIEGNLQ